MEKTYRADDNLWALDTDDEHILHRKGSDAYPEIRHTMVKDPDEWEEVAVEDVPPYTKAEYDAEVERLIAERYSHGKEIEINREHDTKPERFAEYLAYVDECKTQAKELLTSRADEAEMDEVQNLVE